MMDLPVSGDTLMVTMLPPFMPTFRTASSPVSGSITRPPLITMSKVCAETACNGRSNSPISNERANMCIGFLLNASITAAAAPTQAESVAGDKALIIPAPNGVRHECFRDVPNRFL
jgi:hypothetical protein